MEKIESLAKYLEISQDEITESKYDKNLFEVGEKEYLVLTDKESSERVKDSILETLWAFNPDFIANHSACSSKDFITCLKIIQEKCCESCNDIILALIKDIDDFIDDAVSRDGRGHFLSGYDGEENEQDEYFIYRTN